ncbi:uncharacterized protein [Rutidosis leptorrhynchoides]|uniref:uncharacterized protein n=1 Tax=Rutidosis leptorrhynchoides TaxID=125765 RepID=UPI003A996AE0
MAEHGYHGRPRGEGNRRYVTEVAMSILVMKKSNVFNNRSLKLNSTMTENLLTLNEHMIVMIIVTHLGMCIRTIEGCFARIPCSHLGMKVEIPEFTGTAHPDDFLDWLSTVERVFDVKDIPENLKVKLVAHKLRKHASLWWDHVRKQRALARKSKGTTWDKMKRLLRGKFLPENYRQQAFIEYHNLRQGTITVEELIYEFDKIRMRCDITKEEEQIIARFLCALKPEIADVVTLQPYWTYMDVCRLALKVEKQLKSKPKPPALRSPFTPKQVPTPTTKGLVDTRTCTTSQGPTPKAPTCFKCQGTGHYARECPNKRIITTWDDSDIPHYDVEGEFSDPLFTEQAAQEEVLYADQGECLVIHRALNSSIAPLVDDLSWLCNNIFCTKVTAKGKVCSMVIDGGSCENVVSKEMVDKLELKAEDHPEPYCLTWLKCGNHIKVDKRCLVKFSIGNKYHDEVWCEVVPMDACHLLLGRPWQFDRKTTHDGYKNTYSFLKDGTQITLAPLDSRKAANKEPTLFVNHTNFELATKACSMIFALVVEESNEVNDNSPPEVLPLLTDFRDVFPDDIPAGLPPMRDIQHCIDFTPGVVIPNKPAYRLNPKEFAELQRQVGELLEKGLIRESNSPCAVPALLVPKHGGSFRMCIDSRAVNKITVKYRFLIPRFDDLIDQLFGATIFSKIDL